MALITCPECKNNISDQAEKCPKCGYELKSGEPQKEEKKKKGQRDYKYIILGLLIIVVGFFIINQSREKNKTEQPQPTTSSQPTSSTGTGSNPTSSTAPGTNNGYVVYNDQYLGASYEIPSNYYVYTDTKGLLTYVGKSIDNEGARIPYIMLTWDENYNNPVQYLNKFTDELRNAYSDVQITIDLVNGQIGNYLVYGIQYKYTSSGHTVIDNRYVTIINNKVFMITTKEENVNTNEINDIVRVMFNTLKVGN